MRASLTALLVSTAVPLLGCAPSERERPFTDPQLRAAIAAAARVDVDQLAADLAAIVDARVNDPTRDAQHFHGRCRPDDECVYSRAAVADLIRARFSDPALAATTTLHEQTRHDGDFDTTNIFLDIPGETRPDEMVITTAHYDAFYGGANDDGSGVAVVLGAALALKDAHLDRTVRLLLVDGEELGMVGSGRYVDEVGVDGVVAVLTGDMVAFAGDEGGPLTHEDPAVAYWVQANGESQDIAFQMADLARRLPASLAMKPLVFPGDGVSLIGEAVGVDLSDHAQFWLAHTPAIFPFPSGDKPSWYHTADDTLDVVDDARLRAVGPLWAGTLAALATESE